MTKITALIIGLVGITTIGTAQTEILNVDFESGVPANFSIVDNDGLTPDAAVAEFDQAWIRLADPDNPTDTVMGSTSFFSPVGQADRWLITEPITLGAYGNFFYWESKSHDASFPDDYMILLSTTDNQLASFTDTIGAVFGENATWTTRDVDLSNEGYNDQTVYIAFVNRTDDGFKLYIDDIRAVIEDPVGIEEQPTVSVQVFPNPVQDELTIKGEGITSVSIIGLDGKKLIETQATTIRVSELQSGTYFISVKTDKGTAQQSFVKY